MKSLLYIVLDQLRADAVGYARRSPVETPNLDALADQSSVFLNHFTVASPCGPSRASLHSGQYVMLHRSAANGAPVPADIPLCPTLLRAHGFDPVLFGYTDTPVASREMGYADPRLNEAFGTQVLEDFRVGLVQNYERPEAWIDYLATRGVLPVNAAPFSIWDRGVSREEGFSRAPTRYSAEDSDTAFLARAVMAEMTAHASEGFCIHAAFLKPHPPLQAPEPYNHYFDADGMPDPRAPIDAAHPFLSAFTERQRHSKSFDAEIHIDRLTAAQKREIKAVYYGLIKELDDWLGEIIACLKANGAFDETLIVITSDHGELIGDYGAYGKAHVFDPAWHIPLLIKAPGQTIGQRHTQLTESVDVLPTILDYAGIACPPDINGRSLRSWIAGHPPVDWRTAVMCELDVSNPTHPKYEHALGLTSDQLSLCIYRTETHKLVVFTALPTLLFAIDADGTERLIDDLTLQCALLESLMQHRLLHQSRVFARVRVGEVDTFPLGARGA